MNKSLTKLLTILSVVLFISVTAAMLYAYSGGITGKTKKSPSPGCTCHNSSPSGSTVVTISGPDTVAAGQTVQYNLIVSNSSKVSAGVDIAVQRGVLAAFNALLRLESGELTHNAPIPMTSGTVSIPFNYTAPATIGLDSIYANGNAVDGLGSSSGDVWNYASNKRIVVKNASSVKEIGGKIPANFELKQNYPNPFNPSTKIRFSLPSAANVNLVVTDISGKIVAELYKGNLQSGNYEYNFNASNFSSGIYFYKLSTDKYSEVKKMTLLK